MEFLIEIHPTLTYMNTFKKIMKNIRTRLASIPFLKKAYFAITPYNLPKHLSLGNQQIYKRLSAFILDFESYCVVDVGASDGWFSKIIFHFKPDAQIIAFEPLSTHTKALEYMRQRYPKKFEYHLKALGEKEGSSEITEFGTTGLSSLKKLIDGRYDRGGFSAKIVKKETIKITTLDRFFEQSKNKKRLVVKIDTQGFEMEVLKGAAKLFSENRIDCVIIELATIPKYEGQAISTDFLHFFEGHNFILFDLYPFFYEEKGPLTEFDAVFVNRRSRLYEHLYGEKK